MREPLILDIKPFEVQVVPLDELLSMNISKRAYLIEHKAFDCFYSVCQLVYEPASRGTYDGTFYSGWKLIDRVHFSIECLVGIDIEFLQEKFPEVFI